LLIGIRLNIDSNRITKNSRRRRSLVARAAPLSLAVCGTLAGFLLGCALALYQAENWLDQYSTLVAAQRDAASAEAMRVLTAMQASQQPYCSDAEIAHFRELVFRSIYLKDAGRIHKGVIDCSAIAERPGKTLGQFTPEFSQADGSLAFSNLAPIRDPHIKRPGLQFGNAYVVFGRYAPVSLGPIAMQLKFAVNPAAGRATATTATQPTTSQANQAQGLQLTTEGLFRHGDTLYATRCSTAYFKCVTASTTVKEAIRGESETVVGATVLSGLAGGLLGMAMTVIFSSRQDMAHQLRRAIAADRLTLAYQPIVNIDTGIIVGAEALARWADEDGLPINPEVFIPLAESKGFIGSITKLVAHHALRDFGDTLRARTDFRLSINASATDLADPNFLPMLDEAVKRACVPPKRLAIEITESSTANRAEAMETIRELRHRGHSIHIDDFGTGYSSLSYLLYLSVDTIKVDKAFTKAIGTGSVTVAILPQILAMAESLGLGVVAEGVETQQQADYFSGSGRHIDGQGWFFGHPVPAEGLHRLLSAQWAKPQVLGSQLSDPLEQSRISDIQQRDIA